MTKGSRGLPENQHKSWGESPGALGMAVGRTQSFRAERTEPDVREEGSKAHSKIGGHAGGGIPKERLG